MSSEAILGYIVRPWLKKIITHCCSQVGLVVPVIADQGTGPDNSLDG
jgi:hypothetical protein